MSKEIISITKCPLCNESHLYKLEVQRVLLLKSKKEINHEVQKEITQLFMCPKKKEQYQGTFYLKGKIKDVQVIGLEEEASNG